MAKLRDLKLEPFSLALARKILVAFPRWEPFMGRLALQEDDLTVYVLEVELPSANPDVRQPLTITAGLDRSVTVSWFPETAEAQWNVDWVTYAFDHPLLDWRKDDSGFDRIVDWLRSFLSEERAAAFWIRGDGTRVSGAYRLDELKKAELELGKPTLVRSWRGTYDFDGRPEAAISPVIIHGDPDSGIGRFVSYSLANWVIYGFVGGAHHMATDRAIQIDCDWFWTLIPSPALYGFVDEGKMVSRREEPTRPRLFIVRWSGDVWQGPWEEEGVFEIRDRQRDRELLRRHIVAWLREP